MKPRLLLAGLIAGAALTFGAVLVAANAVPEFETVDAAPPVRLADHGLAPELTGLGVWLNSKPLTLAELRGKVVLIDFWTYGCGNCIRTLPHVNRWQAEYADDGLVVIGVHTPEFPFERDLSGLRTAMKRYGVRYPVVQDNDYKTWLAYRNQYWPAVYLIDREGRIVLKHVGEGDYADIERAIRETLSSPPTADTAEVSPGDLPPP